jgi:hypothetical protein
MDNAKRPSVTGELAQPKRPPKAPELPVLAKIINDIIDLDPDYYFSKRYDDIHEAASELPTVIEYINESLQRAAIGSAKAKRDLELMRAETYTRLRENWTTTFSDKMTETALEMAIVQDKNFGAATDNYAVLKSYVGRMANMQENLRAKLDLLRSVEATRRKLIDDDPRD